MDKRTHGLAVGRLSVHQGFSPAELVLGQEAGGLAILDQVS
jgi:hypothetical protein